MLLKKDREAAAKSIEIFKALDDVNVNIGFDSEVCGAEMIPAAIAAGVVVGSMLHTDKELRSKSAYEIILIVMSVAVGIEKELYGDFHRKTYEMSQALAEERFRSAVRAGEGGGDAADAEDDADGELNKSDE